MLYTTILAKITVSAYILQKFLYHRKSVGTKHLEEISEEFSENEKTWGQMSLNTFVCQTPTPFS